MKFKQLPIQKQKILNRLKQMPTFINCFTKNITDAFFEELDKRSHIILFMWGETGTFKSSAMIEIMRRKDKTFNFNRISFHNQQMIEQVKKSNENEAYMRDETPYDVGQGSGRARMQIALISETLRKRGNSLGFISPSFERVATAHYILQTIDATMTEDEVKKRLKAGEDIKEVYVRIGVQDPQTQHFLGSIRVRIEINNDIWLEYDEKKDIAMDEFAKMEYGQISYEDIAKQLLEEIDLEKYRKKGERLMWLKQTLKNRFTTNEIKDIGIAMEQQIREIAEMEDEGYS